VPGLLLQPAREILSSQADSHLTSHRPIFYDERYLSRESSLAGQGEARRTTVQFQSHCV
ncbi:uncharacterized protein METZ01_LOCUS130642, partial [marine metagenome]